MADKLYFKFGIEEDEFNNILVEHKIFDDPEAKRML